MPIFGRDESGSRLGAGCLVRLIILLVLAAIPLVSYWRLRSHNPVTGEIQHVNLSREQEVALGLQAAAEMASQFGGLDRDSELQLRVDGIGRRIVDRSDAAQGEYPFQFRVLADMETVNAFALPGGQVFITRALLDRLKTDGKVAGVLAHEITHVIGRHSAEHIAKAELTQGLTGAMVMATYDPGNPASMQTAQVAMLIGQLINLKYGRNDEIESDQRGVKYMSQGGYDPRAMIEVMKVLAAASEGRGSPPEFFSTHPNPENRIERIGQAIKQLYPQGVPENLEE